MPLNCLLEFDLIYIFNFEETSLYTMYMFLMIFLLMFFIVVAAMDTNVEILIELAHLRGLSTTFSGGDRICHSLASTLNAIVETISLSRNILYHITSYRERKGQEYVDGLDHNVIKKLKITKENIFSLFGDPHTGEIPNTNRPHISIEWCTFQPFVDNWMDKWYMVFDMPPHNNREIPLYFLQNMYAELVLGKQVNYFDILQFQGISGDAPKPTQCRL